MDGKANEMKWKSINFITISPPHVTSKLISIEVFFLLSLLLLVGKYPETWDNNDNSNTFYIFNTHHSVCECTYNWWDFCLMLLYMFIKIINAYMNISQYYEEMLCLFSRRQWIPIDFFPHSTALFIISLSHQSWLIIKVFFDVR